MQKHVYDKQYLARSEGSASGEMGGELVKFDLGKEQVFVFSGSRLFSFTFLPTFFRFLNELGVETASLVDAFLGKPSLFLGRSLSSF